MPNTPNREDDRRFDAVVSVRFSKTFHPDNPSFNEDDARQAVLRGWEAAHGMTLTELLDTVASFGEFEVDVAEPTIEIDSGNPAPEGQS